MSEPIKVAYLISDKYVVRVFHGGGLGALVVCKAESMEWAGRIATALQDAEKESGR